MQLHKFLINILNHNSKSTANTRIIFTCGNMEKVKMKYIMPPIKSNCQFFFRNFNMFPKAICNQIINISSKSNNVTK